MRIALIVLALFALVSPFGGAGSQPPQRDAVAVLKDMRQALGGDAVLDAVKSVSLEAEGETTTKGKRARVLDQYFVVLPDQYVRVRRLGPQTSGHYVTMVGGCRGEQIIGPERSGSSPDSTGDRLAVMKCRHDVARFMLALTGTSVPALPLEFSAAGIEEISGERYEIVDAAGPQNIRLRLYVDAKTHLPAMVVTSGLEKTPELRWFLSDFMSTGRVLWPRQIEEQTDIGLSETLTVKAWKLNPKIDARTFQRR